MAELKAGRGGWIATANVDHLLRLRRSEDFRRAYEGASVVVADGMPLIWASRLQGTPLPERVAGSDLIYSLTAAAARDGRGVFFLGGNPGSAEVAAAKLSELSPGLRVQGTACPPVGFEQQPELVEELSAVLAASGADIVFVALGSPKQELLIERMRSVLPNAWWIGVGISFSFVAGEVLRAPRWMQRLGLEWAHRLTQEPCRLWNRYLVQGLPYASCLMVQSVLRRFMSRSRKS
jgi:N-acetylglucosaminyldiphosphoundecaprenol N-acetyl-beta-D-mannosaminyltransferase